MTPKVFVIAECGSSHDLNLAKAFRLIDAARDAGANCAKFQYWSDADALADRRRVPDRYRAIYRRYQLTPAWLPWLATYAARVGIEFMMSTYVPDDVEEVAPFVQRFKVSSFEAGDEAFLRAHVPFEKPVIISCGMREATEVWRLSDLYRELFRDASLLQCVSAYPVPDVAAMNLAAIRECSFDGLSDHSRRLAMGGLAVAAGAEIIETHLRLDDTDPENPDYATAFTPHEFATYVQTIRFAERAMGDGMKTLQSCERDMAKFRVGGQT